MFVRKLQQEAQRLFNEYIAPPKQLLPLAGVQLYLFHTAISCYICDQPLGGDNVRDHCGCKLPVIIHKLKGYDGHLISKH